jgi:general secretion pathway protein M
MIARLTTWYAGLTARERVLVTVAGALAALIMLVYGIVMPLGSAWDDAAQRHASTVERAGRVLAGLDALKRPAPKSAAGGGPFDQQVAASAEAAGLVLQSSQPRGSDVVAIAIATARGPATLAWLDALAAQGIGVESLTVSPAADGTVSVNATLRRAGS